MLERAQSCGAPGGRIPLPSHSPNHPAQPHLAGLPEPLLVPQEVPGVRVCMPVRDWCRPPRPSLPGTPAEEAGGPRVPLGPELMEPFHHQRPRLSSSMLSSGRPRSPDTRRAIIFQLEVQSRADEKERHCRQTSLRAKTTSRLGVGHDPEPQPEAVNQSLSMTTAPTDPGGLWDASPARHP